MKVSHMGAEFASTTKVGITLILDMFATGLFL